MHTVHRRHVNSKTQEEKETIHSGQFMVSDFEAEEQDDEDELAIPVPEDPLMTTVVPVKQFNPELRKVLKKKNSQLQLEIDTSLSKMFQCMSVAYRQKLTSPKWNRFRGVRLRWKDKIRLNNVIWRCWHLQFIKKVNTMICQFASPLETDTHNKPEAVVLEGKYWKRKLAACTAEYKKWRVFYRNHISGHSPKDQSDIFTDSELLLLDSHSNDESMHMMVDEDYVGLMSDTLFSTIANQPFVFPDSREIARAGLADLIQPSLGPLQPNLEDYMDTFEPLPDFIQGKMLPTVPEEQHNETEYKPIISWNFPDFNTLGMDTGSGTGTNTGTANNSISIQSVGMNSYQISSQSHPNLMSLSNSMVSQHSQQQQSDMGAQFGYPNNLLMHSQYDQQNKSDQYVPNLHDPLVANRTTKQLKGVMQANEGKQNVLKNLLFTKSNDNIYECITSQNIQSSLTDEKIQVPSPSQDQNQQQQQQNQLYRIMNQSHENEFDKVQTGFSQSQGFKFAPPAAPEYNFTSQQDDKRLRNHYKTKPRSRSSTREQIRKPSLTSAVSDPQLMPTPSSESTLLTKLLTGSSDASALFSRKPQPSKQSRESSPRSSFLLKEEKNPISIVPVPQPPPLPPPATLIITPISLNSSYDSSGVPDPLSLTPLSSSSPVLDNAQSLNSPTSSQSSIGSPNPDGRTDVRRVGHIHAEQKRRYNIKNGFDMLHSLIPHLSQNPNTKCSKAAMLQKGAEYIRQLKIERDQLKDEMDMLRQQIGSLNTSISNCQSMLPATGAPVSRRRNSRMQEMFDGYVRSRTMENWKFWIFSLIFRPLLDSFNTIVSTTSLDDLYRTTVLWIEQHCTLVDLRPVVLNVFRYLSTNTEILSEPEKLPEEARNEVRQLQKKK